MLAGSNPNAAIILLTDGENNAGELTPLDAAQLASLLGVRVYTIGAVPAIRQGDLEVDEKQMQRVSETTGGEYHRASDPQALLSIYRGIAELEKSRVGNRGYTDYDEVYLAFLLAGGALLLLETFLVATVFRRVP